MLVIVNKKLIFFLERGENWIVKGLIPIHDDLTSIDEYMFLVCFRAIRFRWFYRINTRNNQQANKLIKQYHNCKLILVNRSQSTAFIAKSAPMVIL